MRTVLVHGFTVDRDSMNGGAGFERSHDCCRKTRLEQLRGSRWDVHKPVRGVTAGLRTP